ncbi:hypothetical protein [Xanthocytophaga flava]|nr:hypothetical protein [Xanthocytophaga flavus]
MKNCHYVIGHILGFIHALSALVNIFFVNYLFFRDLSLFMAFVFA